MLGQGRYEGENKDQVRHGVGVYYYPNKFFKYEGEWKNGKKHGTGKLILGDGGYYEGAFVEGEIEGNGERVYGHSGARYVGHFSKGERHGLGRYETSDGSYYEGNWFYNKKEGFGSSQAANGTVYEGEWHNNIKHGEGMLVFPDGCKYDGCLVNGLRHGHGRYEMADKSVYEGQWKNEMFQGEGTLTHHSGIVRVCPWVKGKPFSNPSAFMFQSKKHIRLDHGKPFSFTVAVVDEKGDIFEEESGRLVQLKVSRKVKTGEEEWFNMLVRKTSESDEFVHTSRSTPNTPFSSSCDLELENYLEDIETPFKQACPIPTVKGIVCFKNVYLPTFPSDVKDKAFNKLNKAKSLIDKVILFENSAAFSDGDECTETTSESNLKDGKAKSRKLHPLRQSENRRNQMRTEDNTRTSMSKPTNRSSKTATEGGKVPKFQLSEDLFIGAFDVTENPFALQIPLKKHPVYSGTPSIVKLVK